MIETVAVVNVVAGAENGVVVLVHVAFLAPLLQEQLVGLLRKLLRAAASS